ncbi:hypothetical protein FRC03_003764 [Tulasnella sp. 419]|nr:hypothetical protein FRC03_003764 [Tulasnella sp. 419]
MMAFALDNPAPATVLLITGDRDFVYAVSVLRHRKYTVALVIPPQGAHITLKSQASTVLDWRYDVFAVANTAEDDTPSTSSGGGSSSGVESTSVSSPPPAPTAIPSPSTEVPLTFGNFAVPKTPPPKPSNLPRPPVTPIESAEDVRPMKFLNGPVSSPTKPATLFRPHSSSISNRSSSPIHPDPIFVNLIEILEYWRLMGNLKPLRSQLGMELRKRNPLFYQRAGVKSFGEYITLAEKAKVVVLGDSDIPGQEWIQLDKAYQGQIYPVYT